MSHVESLSPLALLLLVTLYLIVGRVLYVRKWPNGFLTPRADPEAMRIRRLKRTRVVTQRDERR